MANDDNHEPQQPTTADVPDVASLMGHAVIAGFGVPGRAVADLVHAQGVSFCVIERNDETVDRCRKSGLCMVEGDAGDPAVLRKAGLDRAVLFACTVPNDAAMYEAVAEARRLNPRVRIVARCRYVSSGIEATRRGADEVVVEEQAVAQAFEALLQSDPLSAAPPRVIPTK
jgi:monovalent cation:H+ antiporter-2, CPA2 family